jgi:Ca2+-binding EF-hand superfamily protein
MDSSIEEIQVTFAAVDEDKTGFINVSELQQALAKGGYTLSLTSCAMLIKINDDNRDGRMNFQEFAGLHRFLSQLQAAFAQAAGSPTATQINATQLKSALDILGYSWIDGPAFSAMCLAFDPQRDSLFSLTEMIAIGAYLRSVTAMFKGFDPQGRGMVSMTMNQFLYAASNTR